MDDATTFTATRAQLSAALRKWEAEAKAEGWEERSDDDRHDDNADYLIGLINAGA